MEQTSNAYELLLPGVPVAPRVERERAAVRRRPNSGGQTGPETPFQFVKKRMDRLTGALTGAGYVRVGKVPPVADACIGSNSGKLSPLDRALASLGNSIRAADGDRTT